MRRRNPSPGGEGVEELFINKCLSDN